MKMEMLLFLCFILISTTISQPDDFFYHYCSDRGNYTNTTNFNKNLQTALSSISSNTQTHRGLNNGSFGAFYSFSTGEDPDQVYAMALCRATTALENCRSCVKNATQRILKSCPNQKEGMGWYPECQIKYSNNSYSVFNMPFPHILNNTRRAADASSFNEALRSLLDELRQEAASGSEIGKFASGEKRAPDPNFEKIHAFVECSPDLSSLSCDECLSRLVSYLPVCCNASLGARMLETSCQLEYEIHPFFTPLPPPPPPSPAAQVTPPPTQGNDSNTIRTVIIVVSTVTISMLLIATCIFFSIRRKKYRKMSENIEDEINSLETLQFDFNTVKTATNDFSCENKLGKGGFGAVYKGGLENGQNIAVKRLAENSRQGDLEFRNEVLLMAKLRHRNLLSLLGFCLHRNERLLIYELLPNGSLDHFLFDVSKRTLLDWIRRYKIIVGIARGLLYLHEDSQLRIIHRDLKASNILLDEEMNAKIADFGMARLFALDETRGQTSRIVGTFGYMAPEYAFHGQFSTKSDIFSFGVLVLEIVTGQKVNNFHDGENPEDLLTFAWNKWREGRVLEIIDSTMSSESRMEIMRCIHIGLLCVQENVEARPAIASVIVMLNSLSQTLPLPSKPAFFLQSRVDESGTVLIPDRRQTSGTQSSNYSKTMHSQSSENDASITDLYPR